LADKDREAHLKRIADYPPSQDADTLSMKIPT
jgi:hypothetical protein